MEKNKNQRQPDPGQKANKPDRQEYAKKGRHDNRNEPPAGGHSPEHSPSSDHSDQRSTSGQWKKPVTNHDEQQKTTNSSNADDVMGEQETEGDRRRNERFRSYKTTEDDMKNIERRTPAME